MVIVSRILVVVACATPVVASAAAPRWVDVDGAAVAAADASALYGACVDESRRADAQGAVEVVWSLVASCVEARGVVMQGDPRVTARWSANRWVPEAASCPGPAAAVDWAAAAHACRADAVGLDRDGEPVVDEGAVTACMGAQGLVAASPRAFVAWQAGCGTSVAAR